MADMGGSYRSGSGGTKPSRPRTVASRDDSGTGKQAVPQSLGAGSTHRARPKGGK